LTSSLKRAALLFAATATAAAVVLFVRAQPAPPPNQPNPNLILLDPAHGGSDTGAALPGNAVEKDVTLAFAASLRTALTNAGFTVASTRDADLPSPPPPNPALPAPPVGSAAAPNSLTLDQRAEIANRAHPIACLVLHATSSGSGVHLYISSLQPPSTDADASADTSTPFVPVPWEQAQATSIPQSLALQAMLAAALGKAGVPAVAGRAALRPLDNLTCPAVAVELAPFPVAGADPIAPTDADYQQRVASTLALALRDTRDHPSPPQGAGP